MLNRILSNISLAQIVGVFLLLTAPILFAPFFADDFFHLLLLHPHSPLPQAHDGSLFGLFSIIRNDDGYRQLLMLNGALPWWTGESFYFTFWRPFTELTHWLDYQLAAQNSVFAHLHSLFWFVALTYLLARFLMRLGLDKKLIVLVCLIFVLNGHHAATIAWVANRNALIAAFFALAALFWHVLWREKQDVKYLALALVSLLLAALSGESVVAFGGYFFAYAIILDREGAKKGFLAILPYGVLMLAWLAVYQTLGFATSGSVQYINPISETSAFLMAVLERLPVFLFTSFSALPTEIYPLAQLVDATIARWLWLAMLGAVLLLVMGLLNLLKEQKLVLFGFVAASISIVPFCSLINQDRLLLIPSIGYSLVIAIVIDQILIKRRVSGKMPQFKRLLAYTFVALHLILAPVYLLVASKLIHQSAKDTLNLLSSAPLQVENLEEKTVVIVEGSVLHSALLKPLLFLQGKPMPEQVFLITDFGSPFEIERVGDNRLRVTREKGFVYRFEQYFRDIQKEPFRDNMSITVGELVVQLVETTEDHRPEIIEITLQHPIGSYIFIRETNQAFELLDWQSFTSQY